MVGARRDAPLGRRARRAGGVPRAEARGRIYVDNFNLLSEEGWAVFEAHAAIPPDRRPTHISKASTPQELERYLAKVGFGGITIEEGGLFVRAYGVR